MSGSASTIVPPVATKGLSALSRLLGACCDGVASYFVRRAAIKTLRELDDRALRDIGLVRAQIESAVHGFVSLSSQRRVS
jgi:uncharacterized protein YjiS (DUF1127 family)